MKILVLRCIMFIVKKCLVFELFRHGLNCERSFKQRWQTCRAWRALILMASGGRVAPPNTTRSPGRTQQTDNNGRKRDIHRPAIVWPRIRLYCHIFRMNIQFDIGVSACNGPADNIRAHFANADAMRD